MHEQWQQCVHFRGSIGLRASLPPMQGMQCFVLVESAVASLGKQAKTLCIESSYQRKQQSWMLAYQERNLQASQYYTQLKELLHLSISKAHSYAWPKPYTHTHTYTHTPVLTSHSRMCPSASQDVTGIPPCVMATPAIWRVCVYTCMCVCMCE